MRFGGSSLPPFAASFEQEEEMSSYVERNLMHGETVLYRAKVSPWGLAPLFILGLLLIPAVGLGLVFFLWAWVIYATTEFALTDKRVIAKTGLIARRTVEMFLDKVESLNVSAAASVALYELSRKR